MASTSSKMRKSYYYGAIHRQDKYDNLGYNYENKILRKTTSPILWGNPMQLPLLNEIERLIEFLIYETKSIKKTFSIAHDKNSTNIN